MSFLPIYFADRCFHFAIDVAFFVVSLRYLAVVRGTPTEAQHQRWIIPGLAGGILVLIYSAMFLLHYVFSYTITPAEKLSRIVILDVANVLDFYAALCLLRTLTEVTLWPSGTIRSEGTHDQTVWPPAPGVQE